MLKKNKFIIFCIIALIISTISLPIYAYKKDTKVRKIITFKSNIDKSDIDKILNDVCGERIKNLDNINSVVALIPNSLSSSIKNIQQISYIEDDVEFNLLGKKESPAIPPILQPPQVLPWGITHIEADKISTNLDNSYIKVGVIDTGIDISHPDLVGNIKGGVNTIKLSSNYIDDNGHGTHVAGIIAATDNDIGVVGIAPKVNIYAIKAFNSLGTGYLSDIIEGIDWCIKNKINVINISFGSGTDSQLLHDSIIRANQAGITIVAAAGNDYNSNVSYPASYSEVISVSAIDKNNNIASFAPKGKVDVVAPGVSIYSTINSSAYGIMTGSSMAAPHVTGTVALLFSVPTKVDIDRDGLCSPNEIKEKLESTCIDLGIIGKDDTYGAGLINSYNAVN